MGWTTPRTWVAGEVLTAALLNTHVRDQYNYLRSNATASVVTSETTTSGTYTDLATVGPAVTVTTDVQAIVQLYMNAKNSSAFSTDMGFAVSGATTVAASDPYAIGCNEGGVQQNVSGAWLITGLTAGSNTFTAKYRVTGGTGTCVNRRIVAIPC